MEEPQLFIMDSGPLHGVNNNYESSHDVLNGNFGTNLAMFSSVVGILYNVGV